MTKAQILTAITNCKAAGSDPLRVEWVNLSAILMAMANQVGIHNVKDYGLIDDNTGNNATLFTAMMADVPDGAAIYFPGGGAGYRFTSGVTIDKNVIIYGDGYSYFPIYTLPNTPHKGATNLLFTSPSANFLTINSTVSNATPIVHIRDLTIRNTSATVPTAGNGIYLIGGSGMHTFERITVDRFYNNINCVSANNLRISYCNIIGPIRDGIVLRNTSEPDYGSWTIANNNIYSGMAATSVARGIHIIGGGGIFITENHFNAQNTLTLNTQFMVQLSTDFLVVTSEIKIVNNIFDNYQTNGIKMRNSSGTQIGNVYISGNEFAPTAGTNTQAAIDVDRFGNMIITDSIWNRPPPTDQPFLRVSNGDDITLGIVQHTNYGSAADYELTAVTNFRRATQSDTGLELIKMTKAQRAALIPGPVVGQAIYQTDNTPGLRVYNGTNWMRFTETSDP